MKQIFFKLRGYARKTSGFHKERERVGDRDKGELYLLTFVLFGETNFLSNLLRKVS